MTETGDSSLLGKFFRRRSSAASQASNKSETSKSQRRQSKDHVNPCHRLSFNVGVAENSNTRYRSSMEDVHTFVANFAERLDWGYFALFDGHAGKQAARWCGTNLHSVLEKEIVKNDTLDLRVNLNNAFVEADKCIKKDCTGQSGCTAAVAVLRWEVDDSVEKVDAKVDDKDSEFDFIPSPGYKRMLYTANVGDTRVVLSRDGKALRLSYDHKGSDDVEQSRIHSSGGIVMKSRVNGMLAVTRSLGDAYMKELVIGNPFTTATELNESDEFLIVACDGLWDVCSDQRAVKLISDIEDPHHAANVLCKYAMEHGTTDNVTVMVVRLNSEVLAFTKSTGDSTDEITSKVKSLDV